MTTQTCWWKVGYTIAPGHESAMDPQLNSTSMMKTVKALNHVKERTRPAANV
jgi:hypothetical protein